MSDPYEIVSKRLSGDRSRTVETRNKTEPRTLYDRILLKSVALLFLVTSLTAPSTRAAHKDDGRMTVQEIDRACAQARDNALRPIRARYIEECVVKGDKDRPACERLYADYGDAIQPAGRKFYDLPECVRAFELRHQYRRAD